MINVVHLTNGFVNEISTAFTCGVVNLHNLCSVICQDKWNVSSCVVDVLTVKSWKMDKLIALSGILFFTADIFAIGSLANPDWIVTTGEAGNMRLGLTQHCQIIHRRPEICIWPQLPAEWTLAFLCIVGGIICLTTTCILLLLSHWHRRAAKYVRWVALFAMTLFCLAAVVFPIGFHIAAIGGRPYKLPHHTQVGSAYVLFIMAIFFTVISELFSSRVCLPVL